jgi:hypothetical protein
MGNLIALADNTSHISTNSLSLVMKHDSFVESIQHNKKFYLNDSIFLSKNSVSSPIPDTIGQTEHFEKYERAKHLGSCVLLVHIDTKYTLYLY